MLPTLDTETFEEFVALMAGDEPEEATEFLDLFLEDTANQFQIMREAMASNDWTILSRSAHSVKSSSAQLGAMQLSEHCRWIEESGKGEMDNSIASKLDEAEQEFAQVRSTIGQMYG
jgi:HPt (histidine-containing phosphotransfer) domain-containing protein